MTEVGVKTEIVDLERYKHELLQNLNSFHDVHDEKTKISILNLINDYSEELSMLKSNLQFQYDVDLADVIRTNNTQILDTFAKYDRFADFLENFKKNLIKKQYKLKSDYLNKFQQEKKQKYGFLEKTLDQNGNETSVKSSSNEVQNPSTDAKIMTTTKKITSRLVQSSQILQTSLVQSQLNFDELTIQSDSLSDLAERYGSLKTVLEKSDKFIHDIKISSERDKRRMQYSLVIFGLCVLKVFWGRLFKLPVKFVFKIFLYTFKIFLATIGLISRNSTDLTTPEVDFHTGSIQSSVTQSISIAVSNEDHSSPTVSFTDKLDPTTYSELISNEVYDNDIDQLDHDVIEPESETNGEDDLGDALSRIIDEL